MEILPKDVLLFTSSGLPIPGKVEENLCLKIYTKIKEDYKIPPVHIHLHKNIPIGAGLGGGSADAAFTLKMLNNLFDLKLSDEKMEDYIRPLGSDCAFFIQNKPVLAINKGDIFEKVSMNMIGKFLVLIYPGIHISTKEAYAGVLPGKQGDAIKDITSDKIQNWKGQLRNDFEKSVFIKYPQLSLLKKKLYKLGAFYSSMTGSGSAVYGIFEKKIDVEGIFPDEYKIFKDIL